MFLSKNVKIAALLAVVVLAIISFVTPANAQKTCASGQKSSSSGLPCPTPAPVKTTSEPAEWKGFYVGGYAGYDTGRSNLTTTTVYSRTGYFNPADVPVINKAGHQRVNPKGIVAGGTAGYNFQSGHFVGGVEADFGSMLNNDTATTTAEYPFFAVRPSASRARPRDGKP